MFRMTGTLRVVDKFRVAGKKEYYLVANALASISLIANVD